MRLADNPPERSLQVLASARGAAGTLPLTTCLTALGYFVVSASSLEQATDLAKGCPVLQSGGTVEVRPVMVAD